MLQWDIQKQVGSLNNATSIFNARKLDALTPIKIQWLDDGAAKQLSGLHVFVQGAVGQATFKGDQVIMAADATPVYWKDDGSGNQPNGVTIAKLPPQAFAQEGVFAGYFGLENDGGQRLTSVDTWFKVLGGTWNIGLGIKYFVSDFDKALANAEGQIDQALTDLRAKYTAQAQAAADALSTDTQALQRLASSVGQIQAQIDAGNVITRQQFNTEIADLSESNAAQIKSSFEAIGNGSPNFVDNLTALQTKYPTGTKGLFVTLDTGLRYVYVDGAWKDFGVYQAVGIDQALVDQIKMLNPLPNLIDGQPSPNTVDTVISPTKYLGQDWMQMTSTANTQFRGLIWRIDNPDKILKMANYPVKINFNIQSSINQTLILKLEFYGINEVLLDSKDYIDNIELKDSEILNYQKELSFNSNDIKDATEIRIVLYTLGTDDLGTILINNYSAVLEYKQIPARDYNQLPELIDGSPTPNNNDTVISNTEYLGREWFKMTSTANTQYRGLNMWIDKPDKISEMANYPVKIHFNIQSSINQNLMLDAHFYDSNGQDMSSSIHIDDIALSAWKILNYQTEFSLDSNNLKGVSKVSLVLYTSGTNDLGTVLINNYSAVLEYETNEKLNLLPEVYLDGPTAGMSGTNYVTMQFKFKDSGREVDGFASTKWQGDSSLAYDKKAYRIKTFEDKNLTKKMIFKPSPLWSADSKYNLKAYYTDPVLCRDVVNSNIGTDLWATQKNMPDDLAETNDFGFIDGFPVRVFINNKFAGIYSFNTAKGDYGKNAKAVISGEAYSNPTEFNSLPTGGVKLDGSDFEMVSPDNPTDEIKQAVNSLITFVSTSSDNDFKTQLGTHIDLESLIDYFIFLNVIENSDAAVKNQTLITWDFKKWYFHPYDLDSTYGDEYMGNISDPSTNLFGLNSHLFTRFNSLFANEIKSRYKELRTWLTPVYVLKMYRDHINLIGEGNYKDEFKLWNNPNHDKNNYNFIKIHVYKRFKLLDSLWLQ